MTYVRCPSDANPSKRPIQSINVRQMMGESPHSPDRRPRCKRYHPLGDREINSIVDSNQWRLPRWQSLIKQKQSKITFNFDCVNSKSFDVRCFMTRNRESKCHSSTNHQYIDSQDKLNKPLNTGKGRTYIESNCCGDDGIKSPIHLVTTTRCERQVFWVSIGIGMVDVRARELATGRPMDRSRWMTRQILRQCLLWLKRVFESNSIDLLLL